MKFIYSAVYKFIIWFIINNIAYFIGRISLQSFRINKKIVSCLGKYIIFNDDNFDIEHHKKDAITHYNDYIIIMKYSMIQFYFGNIEDRIDYSIENMIYIIIFMLTIPIFGIIGRIKGLQISCSNKSHWGLLGWITFTIVGLIIACNIGYHIYLAYYERIIYYYVGSMILLSLFLIGSYCVLCKKYDYNFHIHHWFIGIMLCYYFRFNNIISNISYAIAYGIFYQGVIAYGATSIFQN